MSNRTPTQFKVSTGHYRTRAQTRKLLFLPSGVKVPDHVCRLPDGHLALIVQRTAERVQAKQLAAEAVTKVVTRYEEEAA